MNTKTYCIILFIIVLFLFFYSNCNYNCKFAEHFAKYTIKCQFCGKSFSTSSNNPSSKAKNNIDNKLTKHLKICKKNPTNILSSSKSSSNTSSINSTPILSNTSSINSTLNSSLVVSKDGRCGPSFNNTKCFSINGNKTCCSQFGWCGGVQGSNDAWCANSGKGVENGKYDA